MKDKWYLAFVLLGVCICLGILGGTTIVVDPYFHYREPSKKEAYLLGDSRYTDPGMLLNWDYENIITGTSMTRGFNTTEAEELFGGKTIKASIGGSYNKELDQQLRLAWENGNEVKRVIRGVDCDLRYIATEVDAGTNFLEQVSYLMDKNLFTDVNYVFNKSVLIDKTLVDIDSIKGKTDRTSFDDYFDQNYYMEYGRDAVLATYTIGERNTEQKTISDGDIELITANLITNVLDTADMHPETEFDFFIPPYSICQWDKVDSEGKSNYQVDVEQLVINEMLKHDNVKVFAFDDCFDLVCNLDNYMDTGHYGEWVNSQILVWIRNDEHQITADNCDEYIDTIRQFYTTYDYNSLHENEGE